jgi:hypothetical protein
MSPRSSIAAAASAGVPAEARVAAIPCHRVIRSDGTLADYRWGLERKRELIEKEAEGERIGSTSVGHHAGSDPRINAVDHAVHNRPVQATKGNYRVNLRHGVSRVRSGMRHTVGIIFHDAK